MKHCPLCHNDSLLPLSLAYERLKDETKPIPEEAITRILLKVTVASTSLVWKMVPPGKIHPLAPLCLVSLVLLFLDKTIPFYFGPLSVSIKSLITISLAGVYAAVVLMHYYLYKYQLKKWHQGRWCEYCERKFLVPWG